VIDYDHEMSAVILFQKLRF